MSNRWPSHPRNLSLNDDNWANFALLRRKAPFDTFVDGSFALLISLSLIASASRQFKSREDGH